MASRVVRCRGLRVVQNTDGAAGLSGRGAAISIQTIAVEGANIVVREPGGIEALRLRRVDNDPQTITGAWALETTESLLAQHFILFADGRFVMIDPIGDTAGPGHASCGGPGVEFGRYTWDGATGTLTVTAVSSTPTAAPG